MSTNIPISPPLRKKQPPIQQATDNPSKSLKILTWNVAALRTIPSKLGTSEFQNKIPMSSVLTSFFKKYQVDIACIQEHKFSSWDKLEKEYAIVEGYDSFWSFSGSGYAGVVTYVRTGLTKTFTDDPFGKGDDVSVGRCMLTDHGEFMVLNIYAPNAGRGPEHLERKMQFYSDLSRAMQRWTQEGRKVVITGDINTAHAELDIYNPKKYVSETGFLSSEREWITTFLEERKCKDVWREFNPGVRKYTFWDQKRRTSVYNSADVVMREKNCGWRIDVFYANEAMMRDVISTDILSNVMGSDHCPISLTFMDTTTQVFPTPAGAGNLRKATKPQQTLKSFFQLGVKRTAPSAPEIPAKKPHISPGSKAKDKILKKDMTRKRIEEDYSSQESEGSDHEDLLQKAFGVNRQREDVEIHEGTSEFLVEHRKKEAEWRQKRLNR